MWHQLRQPTPVNELRPDLPAEVVELIGRMMSKTPELRPQTPAEVVEVLLPWIAQEVAPPAEDEIPRLCSAAQGQSTGTASLSTINLAIRAGRASSLSSSNLGANTASAALASTETPVEAFPSGLSGALSDALHHLTPQPPKRSSLA